MSRAFNISILAALFSLVIISSASAKDVSTALTVDVQGFKNTNGAAMVALYRHATGFPEDYKRAYKVVKTVIINGSAKAHFKDIVPGEYAVSAFHDENGDEILDKNFMGMPKEGYGVSNNPERGMSAPEFEKSLFKVKEGKQTVTIKMVY